MENVLPDFNHKVVYIFFDSGVQSRIALEAPKFELQGGELFLTGRGLVSKAWGSDLPIAVAWSKVQWYAVFESAAAFFESAAFNSKINKKARFFGWR
jgi:hypothetical protein